MGNVVSTENKSTACLITCLTWILKMFNKECTCVFVGYWRAADVPSSWCFAVQGADDLLSQLRGGA